MKNTVKTQNVYLEFTYHDGEPFAAYLRLPRRSDDTVDSTDEAELDLMVDYTADGRPIGIEILNPSQSSLNALNRVLKSLELDYITVKNLSPLTFVA